MLSLAQIENGPIDEEAIQFSTTIGLHQGWSEPHLLASLAYLEEFP